MMRIAPGLLLGAAIMVGPPLAAATPSHPSSYLSGALGYGQLHTFLASNDDHGKLRFGPLHTGAGTFRVGDVFRDWLGLGFQFQFFNASRNHNQISAFTLVLDATMYLNSPLAIRPSAGFGFGFAQGKDKWAFGYGGPGTLGMALLYEFRVSKRFALCPIASATWLASDGYDGLFLLFGIEITTFFLGNQKDPTHSNKK